MDSTTPTKEPQEIAAVLERARAAAIDYCRLTGKPLGITGEIGEYEAARLLDLKLSAAREAGYDAIDPQGRRYQVKTRCINENGLRKTQRLGSIKLTHPWESVLLVILDMEFRATEIWQAERESIAAAIAAPGSKARNERGALVVSKFKSIGRKICADPMRIVFSRKGFDSGAGGFPSPIIDGRPISLPIPTQRRSVTTYDDIGLGDIVESVTRGRLTRTGLCHHDPMFEDGHCALGQTGAAQTHLHRNGVTIGDVFVFFGLFADADGRDRHHRIFGYLEVQGVNTLGPEPDARDQPNGFTKRHPHTIGEWNPNNTIYIGRGCVATTAPSCLRLSIPGEQVSRWRVPHWLRAAGLTYHGRSDRWFDDATLTVVGRGQEFVSDISKTPAAAAWLEDVKALICEGA